jgi:glucosamine--fructose-6-phosphate aminotransferase (isomerizing)
MASARTQNAMNYFREQILSLPQLIEGCLDPFAAEAGRVFDVDFCKRLSRLFIIGCGDSCFAALASEFAFESIAGVPTEAQNAMTYSRYAIDFAPKLSLRDSAVIGISVSGGVTRTIEGVIRAAKRGVETFAITSSESTPIAKAAQNILTTKAPDVPNAAGVQVPGARSYFASLLMLYVCAIRIGEASGRLSSKSASEWQLQLRAMGHRIQQTIEMCDDASRELAIALKDANEFVFCGSGANHATALFSAAKILEATGDAALGQDIEEWAHLQYFAKTQNTPTFLITARERDASRASEVKTAMQTIGRRVIEVSPSASDGSLVYAPCLEVFAPLVACIPTMLFAAHLAESKNEPYFRAFGGGRSVENGGGISRIRTSALEA